VLQDLEQANAFVVAVDASRSWFRYHPLLADLLQLELRRTAPGEVTALHLAAAGWFAGHAFVVEAVRHAQAAQDWVIAARLLADHWPGLHLDGRATTVRELLARFPHCVLAADAELAAVAAADELTQGSLEAAAGYLGLAEREMASVPPDRQTQAQLLLRIARLMLARHRADLPAVAEEERQLQATAEAHGADQPGLSQDLRALALIGLDSTEVWTGRFHEAELHVDQGIELARQIGRTYLEFAGLAHLATIGISRSFAQAVEYSMQAIELAKGHGWTDDPAAGAAYMTIGAVLTWQGRLAEAEPWLQRAELTVRAEAQPVAAMGLYFNRAALELGRGRAAAALAALQSAERLAEFVVAPNPILTALRAFRLQVEVRLGETEYAERELAGLDDRDRGCGELRIALAVLRLAQHDPYAARAALAPVLDGSAPLFWPHWAAQAFLLEAIAHDALGDPAAAGRALERALDVAEPDGAVLPFLMQPVPRLLERQAGHCTTHAALIAEIFSQLADQAHALPARPQPLLEPLRESEIRILRYLPTNLTLPEIARELHVSHNTVKTHVRSLYTQLGAHRRAEAVDRARALGLLAPGARTR
jgi:LuxR family maltose regulon positive regulatory protein